MKIERVKNKALQKQERKHTPKKFGECGEAIAENAEKRDVSFHVMLAASEKKGDRAACGGSWHFCKRTGSP